MPKNQSVEKVIILHTWGKFTMAKAKVAATWKRSIYIIPNKDPPKNTD